jgi:hypothetical protein
MAYYILVKRKQTKKYIGIVPAKKNVSLKQLRNRVSKNIKKGYTYRIISHKQLPLFLEKIKKHRLGKRNVSKQKPRPKKRGPTRRLYKKVRVKNKIYNIYYSDRKNKKYKVYVNNKWIHFAEKGYRMFPGMKRGNYYCARSSGIKGTNNINSANFWSRLLWKCKGKKSVR